MSRRSDRLVKAAKKAIDAMWDDYVATPMLATEMMPRLKGVRSHIDDLIECCASDIECQKPTDED